MKTFKATISLEAENTDEFEEKMQAFSDLSNELDHEELMAVADFVVEYPNTVKLIKDELPGLKDLNTLELIAKAGGLITKIKLALDKDQLRNEQ